MSRHRNPWARLSKRPSPDNFDPGNKLREAIKRAHGCDSRWIESVPVTETNDGEVVWDGEVQVFALVRHPKATRCFAWSDATDGGFAWSDATDGGGRRFHIVLELGPVTDAVTAVRLAVTVARWGAQ